MSFSFRLRQEHRRAVRDPLRTETTRDVVQALIGSRLGERGERHDGTEDVLRTHRESHQRRAELDEVGEETVQDERTRRLLRPNFERRRTS